jgi:hypothetical protein
LARARVGRGSRRWYLVLATAEARRVPRYATRRERRRTKPPAVARTPGAASKHVPSDSVRERRGRRRRRCRHFAPLQVTLAVGYRWMSADDKGCPHDREGGQAGFATGQQSMTAHECGGACPSFRDTPRGRGKRRRHWLARSVRRARWYRCRADTRESGGKARCDRHNISQRRRQLSRRGKGC